MTQGSKYFSKHQRPKTTIPNYIISSGIILSGTFLCTYYSCLDEVPLTKRKRLLATSTELERSLGEKEYRHLLQHYRSEILPSNHRASMTVKRVGSRIADAANTFAKSNLNEDVAKSICKQPYTFTVVRSDMANAFVLPNNHVFVLTGLFKYARDEDELAAVIGHEMAHNIARHHGEKLSGGIMISMLARITFLFDPSGLLYALFIPAASLMHALPNSREAEAEADRIGLHLASMACFDPKAAKRVFANMEKGDDVSSPPEFLSTHPSGKRRIQNFDAWLPEAEAIFYSDGGMKCQRLREDMTIARKKAHELALSRESVEKFVSDRV